MDINKVHLVTFSPTGTSKRIGEAIVHGTGFPEVTMSDLTLQSVVWNGISRDTLVVITVPVYGGHVAPLALERMAELRADGAPAVAVVVYGNRAYERALVELDAFVSERGLKVIAGGTFVGEHSYSNDVFPIASGRPDADDLEYARLMGGKIRSKIVAASDMENLYGVDVTRIQRPHQPFFPLFRFLRGVMKLRKSKVVLPRTPQVDAERCTHCGRCARHCPAGIIVPGDECNMRPDSVAACIRCCACVKICVQKARTYDTPFSALLSDCFRRPKEDRIII